MHQSYHVNLFMSRRGFLESLQVVKKAFYARAVLGFV